METSGWKAVVSGMIGIVGKVAPFGRKFLDFPFGPHLGRGDFSHLDILPPWLLDLKSQNV
jgi:hypothetical protein